MKLLKSIIENPNKIKPSEYKKSLQHLYDCAVNDIDIDPETMTLVVKYLLDSQTKNKVKTFETDEQWLNNAVSKDDTRKALT